jgi:hypothetical protein
MFKNALIALGLVLVFAASGCVVYDGPRCSRSRVVVVEERPRYCETVVVRRGYCR